MNRGQMAALLDLHDLDKVWAEVGQLLRLMSPKVDLNPAETAYQDLLKLFAGRFPGYRACNTQYHDVGHTTDTLVAMVRLMHGAFVTGEKFTDRELVIATVCALFHDAGYIQDAGDMDGTGAKHTACHVDRSIAFMDKYLRSRGFPEEYPGIAASILRCTGLNVKISTLEFPSPKFALLGKMLGSGDLLGQMADRFYLEKLLFLYYEFKEGNVRGFNDEFDLLKKTLGFAEMTRKRLATELSSVDRYMRPHFRARWGVDKDLYAEAITNHLAYLKMVIEKHPHDYRQVLRRGGMVDKLKKIYGC